MTVVIKLLFSSQALWASWVKQGEDTLKAQIGVVIPRYNIDIVAPKGISNKIVYYEPNAPTKTALGFTYRNIGATVSLTNPINSEEKKNLGSSTATDLQLRFFGLRTYEFFYQTYNGYYIQNSADFDSQYASGPARIQRPDLESKNLGFNLYWSRHEKDFSQLVAFDQAGFQKSSGWGASWVLHASQSEFKAGSSLVPSSAAAQFGSIANLNGLARSTFAAGASIGGILAYQPFYLSGLFAVGVGHQSYRLSFAGDEQLKQASVTGTYNSVRLGLGVNSLKHVFSAQILFDAVSTPYETAEIKGNTINLSFNYAYRFSEVNIEILNPLSALLD